MRVLVKAKDRPFDTKFNDHKNYLQVHFDFRWSISEQAQMADLDWEQIGELRLLLATPEYQSWAIVPIG